MSDLYEQIVNERGSFERLIARLPGFKGYQEKTARRKADQMLRDHLAEQIDQTMLRITRLEKKILDNGGLAYMSKTRDAKDKVRVYHDRLKAAAPGYSAMWSAVKINEEDLQSLYQFDELQVRFVDQLNTVVDQLEEAVNSGEGIDEAISAVYDTAVEADEAFKKRESVLTNLDKSL